MKRLKLKLKKGDQIIVTGGKDRGKMGKIDRAFPKKGEVEVQGINQYKKHRKPQGEGKPGEIITLTRPISVAKIALVCPKCKQPTRVGYAIRGDKKVRVCRKCDNPID